jgi:hypothetical protein
VQHQESFEIYRVLNAPDTRGGTHDASRVRVLRISDPVRCLAQSAGMKLLLVVAPPVPVTQTCD